MKVAHIATIDASVRVLLLNQLLHLQRAGYGVVAVSSPGKHVPEIEAAGIRHFAIPMTRNLTPFRDLLTLWRLYSLMRRERFTVVHTHTPKPGLLGQLAARLAGVPIVVNTVHGFYFHENMSPRARRFYIMTERIGARCSSLILSQNNEDIRTAVRERICTPNKIRLLGNGIDLERFDPSLVQHSDVLKVRGELGIPENALVVGFVGRFVREKGLIEVFEAARIVRSRVPNVRFLFAGGFDSVKADAVTPATAETYEIHDICHFAGMRDDMPEIYALMDVLILPSHREGFPRAPMEAAAMGIPSVVTDVRGCREVVVHGETGLIVRLLDTSALADAILSLLLDEEFAARLGRAARSRAEAEFDENMVFGRVEAHYLELLERHGLEAPCPVPAR